MNKLVLKRVLRETAKQFVISLAAVIAMNFVGYTLTPQMIGLWLVLGTIQVVTLLAMWVVIAKIRYKFLITQAG